LKTRKSCRIVESCLACGGLRPIHTGRDSATGRGFFFFQKQKNRSIIQNFGRHKKYGRRVLVVEKLSNFQQIFPKSKFDDF
jgi:hypothetical protein